MKSGGTVTIKELHARTGPHVRRAAKSPVKVTDRGKLVAVLAAPHLLMPIRRNRVLLPEYQALLARRPSGNGIQEDLDAVRGER
jgi:antitoxin (DNA-binding transcriptional repressor) of toxin-antitoxin stability system